MLNVIEWYQWCQCKRFWKIQHSGSSKANGPFSSVFSYVMSRCLLKHSKSAVCQWRITSRDFGRKLGDLHRGRTPRPSVRTTSRSVPYALRTVDHRHLHEAYEKAVDQSDPIRVGRVSLQLSSPGVGEDESLEMTIQIPKHTSQDHSVQNLRP